MSKYRELIVGIFFLILSILYFWQSLSIKSMGLAGQVGVGPTFMPEVIAVMTALLSIVLIISSIRALKKAKLEITLAGAETKVAEEPEVRYLTVVLTGLLLLAYAFCLEPLGFMPTTFSYLFLQFNVAAPKTSKTMKYQAGYLATAIGVALVVNYVFVNLFNVMLPQGIFG